MKMSQKKGNIENIKHNIQEIEKVMSFKYLGRKKVTNRNISRLMAVEMRF
jgi:hypothetical protein